MVSRAVSTDVLGPRDVFRKLADVLRPSGFFLLKRRLVVSCLKGEDRKRRCKHPAAARKAAGEQRRSGRVLALRAAGGGWRAAEQKEPSPAAAVQSSGV